MLIICTPHSVCILVVFVASLCPDFFLCDSVFLLTQQTSVKQVLVSICRISGHYYQCSRFAFGPELITSFYDSANFLKVVEMEKCLQEANNLLPPREIICALAEKFRYKFAFSY